MSPKRRNRKASEPDRQAYQDISVGALLVRIGNLYIKRGLEKNGDNTKVA